MSFGDGRGPVADPVGEENIGGVDCMFTMMNNARLAVGLQGIAIAERAYQQARDYALHPRPRARAVDAAGPARSSSSIPMSAECCSTMPPRAD